MMSKHSDVMPMLSQAVLFLVTEASSYFRGCVAVLPALATKVRALASNCALMATMIVLADMRAAPTAGLMTMPHE